MTLHFAQIFFTDARTFILLPLSAHPSTSRLIQLTLISLRLSVFEEVELKTDH